MTGDGASRSLLLAYTRHKSGIGLQLTVEMEFRIELVSQTCGLNHLVNNLMLGTALGREAEHSDARIGYTGY